MKTLKADTARINDIDIFQSSVFDSQGNLIAHGYGKTKEEAERNSDLLVSEFNSNKELSQLKKLNTELIEAADKAHHMLSENKHFVDVDFHKIRSILRNELKKQPKGV